MYRGTFPLSLPHSSLLALIRTTPSNHVPHRVTVTHDFPSDFSPLTIHSSYQIPAFLSTSTFPRHPKCHKLTLDRSIRTSNHDSQTRFPKTSNICRTPSAYNPIRSTSPHSPYHSQAHKLNLTLTHSITFLYPRTQNLHNPFIPLLSNLIFSRSFSRSFSR